MQNLDQLDILLASLKCVKAVCCLIEKPRKFPYEAFGVYSREYSVLLHFFKIHILYIGCFIATTGVGISTRIGVISLLFLRGFV